MFENSTTVRFFASTGSGLAGWPNISQVKHETEELSKLVADYRSVVSTVQSYENTTTAAKFLEKFKQLGPLVECQGLVLFDLGYAKQGQFSLIFRSNGGECFGEEIPPMSKQQLQNEVNQLLI
jgi:hypothetical protein